MFRLGTLQPGSRTAPRSGDQKNITVRKWPQIIRLIVIQLTLMALVGGLFAQATPVYALSKKPISDFRSNGPVSYMANDVEIGTDARIGHATPHQQLSTTLDVDIISTPWAPVDSNGQPGQLDGRIPRVYVVEAAITNSGSTTATNVVINLDYNPTGDWAL